MDPRIKSPVVLSLALGLGLLAACSDSSEPEPIQQHEFSPDSLDSLAPPPGQEADRSDDPEPTVIDQSAPASEPTEEEREWQRERESQTNYGRTRDRVRSLTNQMQDGTEAEDGLAATLPEEEWVGTGGVRWDMPDGWRMAVPSDGRLGQMHIPSQLGAASVAFTRETGSVAELERRVAGMMVSMTGGRVTPRAETQEILGRPVRTLALEGSLIDPSAKGGTGETPFQAVRAAIVDLGEARALIVMWGPEDTVRNNEGKFGSMINGMSER